MRGCKESSQPATHPCPPGCTSGVGGSTCPRCGCGPAPRRGMCAAGHAGRWQGLCFSLPWPRLLGGYTNAWQAPGPLREIYRLHRGDLRRAGAGGEARATPGAAGVQLPGISSHGTPPSCSPGPSDRASPGLSGDILYFKTANQQLAWCEMRAWKRPQPPQTA